MPRTLSLRLDTGFLIRFSLSPLASLSRPALFRICSGSRLRTQMTFSLPFT